MVVVVVLITIALLLFWLLPTGIAIAGAVIAALIVAAKLHDAARRGRLVIEHDNDHEISTQALRHRNTLLYAMWIGLTVSGSGHHHDSGSHVHGQHGSDFGGGFHDGGGGDAGGM